MSAPAKFNYGSYLPKILYRIAPDKRMSKDAKEQINMFLNLIVDKIAKKAVFLVKNNFSDKKPDKKGLTIDARTIQTATLITLTGELAKHAISEGRKALTFYSSAIGRKGERREKKARLVMPISRVENQLRDNIARKQRLGDGASVYLTAVVEYLSAEVLELAGLAAMDNGKKTLSPRFVFLGIFNDEELAELARRVKLKVSGGGVMPDM